MDRNDLYAELSFDNQQWGELSMAEDKKFVNVIIYPDASNILTFKYDEFTQLIERAKSHLLRLEGVADT